MPHSVVICDRVNSRQDCRDRVALEETVDGSKIAVSHRTLHGGVSEGVEVVTVDNGRMQIHLLPTRGMGVWFAEVDGKRLGWDSPIKQPVHPQFVNLHSRNGLGWLDGFNELICRCGLASNGPPEIDEDSGSPVTSALTLHGRIANLPAHRVEAVYDDERSQSLAVVGEVDECAMFAGHLRLEATIRTAPGAASFELADTITNLGGTPAELQLLYHTNIGPPFLASGGTLAAPAASVTPRDPRAAEGIDTYATLGEPEAGYAEQVYFYTLRSDGNGQTAVLLQTADQSLGIEMTFSTEQLPCFSHWKNTQDEKSGYVTGLEPATNFPNPKSIERKQGRVVVLAPGEQYRCGFTLRVLDSVESVKEVEARIQSLQESEPLHVAKQPTGKVELNE